MSTPWATDDETLDLPRVLCLHGGGVSGEIFELQCRGIIRRLNRSFRFVFVNGPWLSNPHPDIVPYFGEHGPFYRWLRWIGDPGMAHNAAALIRRQLVRAMDRDEGTGDYVGILGFSQGARVAASVLWGGQLDKDSADPLSSFRFGVIMNGRGPPVDLRLKKKDDEDPAVTQYIVSPETFDGEGIEWPASNVGGHVLTATPTLHVHGLKDPGLVEHQRFFKLYFQEETASLFEWDGEHRIPVKLDVVDELVGHIKKLAEKAGVATQD